MWLTPAATAFFTNAPCSGVFVNRFVPSPIRLTSVSPSLSIPVSCDVDITPRSIAAGDVYRLPASLKRLYPQSLNRRDRLPPKRSGSSRRAPSSGNSTWTKVPRHGRSRRDPGRRGPRRGFGGRRCPTGAEVGAADAVVAQRDPQSAVTRLDVDGDGGGLRVLRVRQRLGDDVVRAGLDRLREAP